MRTSYVILIFLILAFCASDVSAGQWMDEEGPDTKSSQAPAYTEVRRDFSSGIFLRVLVRFYQLVISPQDIPACRFNPTCSEFSALSTGRYGPIRGTIMTFDRLQRCHPFIRKGDYPFSDDMIHFYDPPERHLLWKREHETYCYHFGDDKSQGAAPAD